MECAENNFTDTHHNTILALVYYTAKTDIGLCSSFGQTNSIFAFPVCKIDIGLSICIARISIKIAHVQ